MTAKKPPTWIDDVCADLPTLLTLEEASKALRVSKRTLQRWIAVQTLRAVRQSAADNARVLIPRVEVKRYLEELAGCG